jgi:hypothetical protein
VRSKQRKDTDTKNQTLQVITEGLIAAKLADLDRFAENPTQKVVRISSKDLGLLTGRTPAESSSSREPIRLVFGLYTHTPPAAMFKRFAAVLNYLETNLSRPSSFDRSGYLQRLLQLGQRDGFRDR